MLKLLGEQTHTFVLKETYDARHYGLWLIALANILSMIWLVFTYPAQEQLRCPADSGGQCQWITVTLSGNRQILPISRHSLGYAYIGTSRGSRSRPIVYRLYLSLKDQTSPLRMWTVDTAIQGQDVVNQINYFIGSVQPGNMLNLTNQRSTFNWLTTGLMLLLSLALLFMGSRRVISQWDLNLQQVQYTQSLWFGLLRRSAQYRIDVDLVKTRIRSTRHGDRFEAKLSSGRWIPFHFMGAKNAADLAATLKAKAMHKLPEQSLNQYSD